jgi:DNA-binding winged helix-turn-helix (wHTH) protein
MRVRLGESVFDGEARELRRGGAIVPLSPKALQLLTILIERRPQAVSKNDLHDSIWPGVFVSYTSLPRVVAEVRRALGDRSRRPRFVRNVHGFGYALIEVEVEDLVQAAAGRPSPCRLEWGTRRFHLAEGATLIGRAPDCVARIDSILVSRHHARITVSGGTATLEDCRSKNGSYVGGTRVEGQVNLADGDTIKVGKAILVFRVADHQPADSTATEDIDV